MSEKTKIAWTDSTINFWSGCTKVSPGCANCYAEALSNRQLGNIGKWGKDAPRKLHESAFKLALRLNKKPWICDRCGHAQHPCPITSPCQPHDAPSARCMGCGAMHESWHRRRIFSLSLGDWLDNEVPVEWLARMLDTIRQCDQVTWILCTKRPENFFSRLIEVDKFLSCGYPAHHENTIQRSVPLRIGEVGGTENRQAGPHLEIEKAVRETVAGRNPFNKMPDDKGRVVQRSVSSSQGDAKRSEEICGSGKAGLASFQGINPAGIDRESQGRNKDQQSPKQFGIGDTERTDAAPLSKTWVQGDRPSGNKELGNSPDRTRRDSNASTPSERGINSVASESVYSKPECGMDDLHRENVEASALKKWVTRWLQCVPPKNVILLTSVENQPMADKRIPELLKIPAACRGLSLEPLLSAVEISRFLEGEDAAGWRTEPNGIDWLIIGGESGPKAREFQLDWGASLIRQGKAAGVPVFFKQAGSNPNGLRGLYGKKGADVNQWPKEFRVQEWPKI